MHKIYKGGRHCDNRCTQPSGLVWISAIEEFDYDCAWLHIDDCMEFECLGVGYYGEGNIVRATRDYRPAAWDTLNGLKIPAIDTVLTVSLPRF